MRNYLLIKSIILIFLLTTEICQADFWLKTKGPYGAKISKIAIDSSNGFIYLATKSDGVYRSTNNGLSWNSLNDVSNMPPQASVNSIAIGSTGTLYAATDSLGIIKKISNQSWSKKTVSNNPKIYSIYILNNGDLLAGTNISAVAKSVNDGNNWSLNTSGLSSITDVYAIVQAINGTVFIGTDKGIFKSSDNGQTWSSSDNTPGKVNCFCMSNDGLIIMAGSDKGIYASVNNGNTWNAQSSGMPANTKVISLAYHKDGYFVAGTEANGLFYSTPSTYVWNAYNTGLEDVKIRAVATSPQGDFYAATNFAFYKASNNVSGWTSSNTELGLRTINGFALIAERADILAATDLGIYRTTNSGDSWTQLNKGLGEFLDISALVIARNGTYFAGTKGDGLYFSTNLGSSWSKLNDVNLTANYITTLDTNSKGILWAGTKTKGVFKSNDITGMSWGPTNGGGLESYEILSFVAGANDVTYAGTNNNGIFRKTEQEQTWSKIDMSNFGGGYIVHSLAYTPIGVNGILYAGTNINVRRSTDNSLTPWNSIGGTLKGPALTIAACENGWVLVGIKNRTGVYIDSTTKNGDTWTFITSNKGINNYETQTMAVSGRGYIFAGTIGGGCYRSVESTSSRMLEIFVTNQSDTIQLQQGDQIDLDLEVLDGGGNPISGVALKANNDLGVTINDLTTNASGVASTQITIPTGLTDGMYTITFLASKINYLDSEIKTVFLDVQRQKIFLDIEPKTEQYRDWDQDYEFEVYAKNRVGDLLSNITVYVNDKLTNNQQTLTTDAEGEVYYSNKVPDSKPETSYDIIFVAEDPSSYYFPSDTVIRIIIVDHNDIPTPGPLDVCVTNTYSYTYAVDNDKSYLWKNCIGGTFLSSTTGNNMDILWNATGEGKFTVEQTIISTQVKTEREFTVTINELPVVTFDDFASPVCPNEPYDLSQAVVTPLGGVFSGPGVNGGFFYGDSAGGAGSYPIKYTYTSDVEPYCENSVTKNITVSPLPNVTLVLDSSVFCASYFPFELTGGQVDGNKVDGIYTGPGVSNNILDPSAAGEGTHEITFSYTDDVTGCTNEAKQNIIINPAPTTSFVVPNPEICESVTDFDLSDKVPEAGTFVGVGVDNANKIFNAQVAGVGVHRIEFYTDNKIGNCPGMAYVNLTVVPVPTAPTISFGPEPNKVFWLASSAKSDNTWYRGGKMIDSVEGRHADTIYPEIDGLYTVTVKGTTYPFCESFHSSPFDFTATAATGSFTTEASETGEISPGKIFNVTIKFGNVTDIKDKQINKVTTELIYNASVLYPEGSTPKGIIVNGWRHIPLTITFEPNNISQDAEMTKLEFMALVGSEESTELRFDSVQAWQDNKKVSADLGIDMIEIKIKVNRNGGKPRLYGQPPEKGGFLYSSVKPNPAAESFKLDYALENNYRISIYITNVNGQILKAIYDGESNEQENSVDIDASDLQTGVYYLILQTPFDKEAKLLQIIR